MRLYFDGNGGCKNCNNHYDAISEEIVWNR